MTSAPFNRGVVEVVWDPQERELGLRETLASGQDLAFDLAGLGMSQTYAIFANVLLPGTDVIAVEEPEAHLHAPTTGRDVRATLHSLVADETISQLFVATHSNLFDLDTTGYWDVSISTDEGTVLQRKSLDEIDRLHLYEPGPAKHALQSFLTYMSPDEVVFRRPGGEAVSAAEMIRLLQSDDDVAVSFLRDVHDVAVRTVRVRSQGVK
jgi:hypothetical protein